MQELWVYQFVLPIILIYSEKKHTHKSKFYDYNKKEHN